MKEALRQIEEFVEIILAISSQKEFEHTGMFVGKERKEDWIKRGGEALQALSALRSLLEGDAGEDEKIIDRQLLNWRMKAVADNIIPEDIEKIDKSRTILARLSTKAKIGEAEIREAKKEVLEELIQTIKTFQWIEPTLGRLTEADRRCGKTVSEILTLIDFQLAALDKEAGRG